MVYPQINLTSDFKIFPENTLFFLNLMYLISGLNINLAGTTLKSEFIALEKIHVWYFKWKSSSGFQISNYSVSKLPFEKSNHTSVTFSSISVFQFENQKNIPEFSRGFWNIITKYMS